MSEFARILNGVKDHGIECADFAFAKLGEVDFDPAAIEITRALAHQQIGEDMVQYGSGKLGQAVLRTLATKSCEAFDQHLTKLLGYRPLVAANLT